MCKVAFGFDKGDVGSVPTGGKKIKDHHYAIVVKLFLNPEEPFRTFVHDDLETLDDIIRNCINMCVWVLFVYQMLNLFPSLKTQYGKYRKMMSETGQGLLDNSCEDEIAPGSEIANIWGRYQYHMFIYHF
jgi:hypothetical protein